MSNYSNNSVGAILVIALIKAANLVFALFRAITRIAPTQETLFWKKKKQAGNV